MVVGSKRRISFKDLLGAGLLRAGEELVCEPRRGEIYKAILKADGKISYNGQIFGTPSGWAKHVAGNSRDGFRDVEARGRPLSYYKEQLAPNKPNPVDNQPIISDIADPKQSHTLGETHVFGSAFLGDTMRDLIIRNRDSARKAMKDKLMAMSPKGFEEIIGALLKTTGFSEVQITQRSHDGGIDGICQHPVLKLAIPFQAKRWTGTVGVNEVSSFRGRVAGKFAKGIFITTSSFTPAAQASASEWDEIELMDGDTLIEFMMEKGIGIKEQPVTYIEIDDNFFTQFS